MACQYITTVKQKVVTMTLKIQGIATVLKGKQRGINRTTSVSFVVDGVEEGAEVIIERRNTPAGKIPYKWSGQFGDLNKRKIELTCNVGDTFTIKRGRRRGLALGAGDVIEVDITVTNPDGTTYKTDGDIFVEIT